MATKMSRAVMIIMVVGNLYQLINITSAQIGAKCNDISWSGSVWGVPNCMGVNLTVYTNNELQLIVVFASQNDGGFYCSDTATSITFGGKFRVNALLGSGALPTSGGCCSATNPRGHCHSPDDQASVTRLCEQLGYTKGTFIASYTSTACPEVVRWNASQWTSDYASTGGYGKEYTCSYTPPAKCNGIEWSGTVWSYANSMGVNLSAYTNNELQLILTIEDGFYCFDTETSITFGGTKSLRALLGSGTLPTSTGCCSATEPRDVCNSPDDQVSVTALCRQLGYTRGTFIPSTSNTCPEVHYDGSQWTSDYMSSGGYGEEYTCTVTPPVKCDDVAWSGTVWGYTNSEGINLTAYTNSELQLITTDIHDASSFYCSDTAASITFGSTSVLRTLLGSGALPTNAGCCSSTQPRLMCNAPDDQASITELCKQLGYTSGTFIAGTSNTCPEAHFDGAQWTSDYVNSEGYAKEITCYHFPTLAPTTAPTSRPTVPPTIYPTRAPTEHPTSTPSKYPTLMPSDNPSPGSTQNPTGNSIENPTENPILTSSNTLIPHSYNPTETSIQNTILRSILSSRIQNEDKVQQSTEFVSDSNKVKGIIKLEKPIAVFVISTVVLALLCLCVFVVKRSSKKKEEAVDSEDMIADPVFEQNIVEIHQQELPDQDVARHVEPTAGEDPVFEDDVEGFKMPNIVNCVEGKDATLEMALRKDKEALDIQYWLEHVVALPQYFDHFVDSGYESMDFIKEITNVMELMEIGIESKKHQQKIFREIKKLKANKRDRTNQIH